MKGMVITMLDCFAIDFFFWLRLIVTFVFIVLLLNMENKVLYYVLIMKVINTYWVHTMPDNC